MKTRRFRGIVRSRKLACRVVSCISGCLVALALSTAGAEARSLQEIAQSKTLKVGVRVRDLVYSEKKKELHNKLAEKFAEYLGQKLKAKIKIELVVSPDLASFWKNDAGVVKEGESYTPAFFKKADVYTDVLTMTGWRQKLAQPVAFLPVKESFLCNFKVKKINLEEVKKQGIKIYTVKSSSYQTLLLKQGYTESEFLFSKDVQALPADTEKHVGNACTVLNSDFALFNSKSGKLIFAGLAGENMEKLAWWTAKENTELHQYVQSFWTELLKSPEWSKEFKKAYGMEYGEYINIVGNL